MFDTNNLKQLMQKIETQGWATSSISTLLCKKLKERSIAIEEAGLLKPAHITKSPDTTNTPSLIRNDLTYWIEKDNHPIEAELFASLTNLMDELKNYFRISLTHFECHFALYPQGHYYKKHIDQTANNNKRFFSFVIYLNEDWGEDFAGKLIGYRGAEKIFSVLPSAGQIIIFRSDIPHEVEPSLKPRRSIAGWFRI